MSLGGGGLAAPDVPALAAAVAAGTRRALAQAITIVESQRTDHRAAADLLLGLLMPRTGGALRIGISGAPGVGKSTFIEAFGQFLIARGHRPAVLAVDPSSPLTGGSILGDKTRMETLSRDPRAFIRPSPAGTTLGGVARRTREASLLCEAAGFDVVVVETVGVGQSETAVAEMVDLFLLLLPPGGGDDLQGIKKGIVELADIVLVNKADGDLAAAAQRAAADYRAAIGLLRPARADWVPPVLLVSARERSGIDAVWTEIARFRDTLGVSRIAERRARQAVAWMWREIETALRTALAADPRAAPMLPGLEAGVAAGRLSPVAAARQVLAAFLDREAEARQSGAPAAAGPQA
ncbi:MAG: methylmalonyl Co-A mutase-associated GTPase MeaB [Rhodospirillales bacterium]